MTPNMVFTFGFGVHLSAITESILGFFLVANGEMWLSLID